MTTVPSPLLELSHFNPHHIIILVFTSEKLRLGEAKELAQVTAGEWKAGV